MPSHWRLLSSSLTEHLSIAFDINDCLQPFLSVTLGELLDGGWSPEILHHDQKLGTFSLNPTSLERGEGLEIKLIIDYAYVMKLS